MNPFLPHQQKKTGYFECAFLKTCIWMPVLSSCCFLWLWCSHDHDHWFLPSFLEPHEMHNLFPWQACCHLGYQPIPPGIRKRTFSNKNVKKKLAQFEEKVVMRGEMPQIMGSIWRYILDRNYLCWKVVVRRKSERKLSWTKRKHSCDL